MAPLLTERARAYANHGRWIADCPRPDCYSAEQLASGQATFHCSNCLQVAPVDWPPDVDEITAVLARRPVPQTRNWFPAGHPLAERSKLPRGQTVAELVDENREHGVK